MMRSYLVRFPEHALLTRGSSSRPLPGLCRPRYEYSHPDLLIRFGFEGRLGSVGGVFIALS